MRILPLSRASIMSDSAQKNIPETILDEALIQYAASKLRGQKSTNIMKNLPKFTPIDLYVFLSITAEKKSIAVMIKRAGYIPVILHIKRSKNAAAGRLNTVPTKNRMYFLL